MLEALGRRGFATVPEPGRRIVAEELARSGNALPWVDLNAFASRAVETAKSDLANAESSEGIVFFDRGLIDAALAAQVSGGPSIEAVLAGRKHYARRVFIAPPWPEIFETDAERRHDFGEARAEYGRILHALDKLGYEVFLLPKVSVRERADIVLREVSAS